MDAIYRIASNPLQIINNQNIDNFLGSANGMNWRLETRLSTIYYRALLIIYILQLSYRVKSTPASPILKHPSFNFTPTLPFPHLSPKNASPPPPLLPLLRQLFIDYHYNFQMSPSKQHFLFLLIFIFIVRSQVLNPLSNCLGHCMHCAPADLALCKGAQPCQPGYYTAPNGTCLLAPSRKLLWAQLGERTTKSTPVVSESWGDSTRQVVCEYNSPSGKKYIDALGLFGGVTMLQKTFPVDSSSQVFELSFNLLRDEWMPFNDFLLIDISSREDTLQSLEISYQQRIKVESQQTPILCGNRRVISEKYNVKIHINNDIANSLTIVFTSFLYLSQWGLSNIKLVSACTHFSLYDENTQACSICDTDSYVTALEGGEKVCEKCPALCRTCSSRSNCTSCLSGAILDKNGACSFGAGYKTQLITATENTLHTCSNYSFYLSSSARKISFSEMRNEDNLLYDEIQLHFKVYYHPRDWQAASTDRISIKINKVEVFTLNRQNLTNKGTISCRAFKSNSTAVLEVVTPHKIHNDNSITVEVEYIGKNKDLQFGVSDLSVKSLKKEAPVVNIPIPTIQEKAPIAEFKPPAIVSVPNVNNLSKSVDESPLQINTTQVPNKIETIIPTNSITNITVPNNISSNPSAHIETMKEISNATNTNNESVLNETTDSPKSETNHKDESAIADKTTEIPIIKETPKKDTPVATQTKKPLIVNNEIPDIQQNTKPSVPAVQKINEESKITTNNQPKVQPSIVPQPVILPIATQTTQNTPIKPVIYNTSTPTQIQQAQPQQPAPSSNAAYIPTSNNDHSGLHVVITKVPSLANSSLRVSIDKLDQDSYQLSESYIQDGDLHLFVAIGSSFIDGKMTVYKVSSSRLLQAGARGSSQVIAVVAIDRYDSLSSSQLFSISTFSTIFQIFAWVGVVSIIVATLSGYGIVVQEYIMSLQLLFLHVYIAADYLPLTFRDVIGGLNRVQNLDFMMMTHGAQIEKSWLGNVIQNGPIKFFLFNTDINFTREFYPIIIVNIAYAIWFAGLFLTRKFLLRQDLIDQEKPVLYRVVQNIVCRPINYLDQIWRYQFLATMWCCFIQFYNLTYPQGSNRSEILNALLCVLALVCSLGWPVFLANYSRKYFYENEYSDFLYRFEDVYFGRIHECFLPSTHTRIGYPIVRSAKLLLSALIIAYFGNIASLTLLSLVGLQIFQVGYAKHYEIFMDHKYFAHRLIENVLFALIELILFFLCTFSSLALTESYVYIGFVLSGMSLLIVVNSVGRAVHLGCQKYRKMFQEMNWQGENMFKPKTERVV